MLSEVSVPCVCTLQKFRNTLCTGPSRTLLKHLGVHSKADRDSLYRSTSAMQGQAAHGRALKQAASLRPDGLLDIIRAAEDAEAAPIYSLDGLNEALQAAQEHIQLQTHLNLMSMEARDPRYNFLLGQFGSLKSIRVWFPAVLTGMYYVL